MQFKVLRGAWAEYSRDPNLNHATTAAVSGKKRAPTLEKEGGGAFFKPQTLSPAVASLADPQSSVLLARHLLDSQTRLFDFPSMRVSIS